MTNPILHGKEVFPDSLLHWNKAVIVADSEDRGGKGSLPKSNHYQYLLTCLQRPEVPDTDMVSYRWPTVKELMRYRLNKENPNGR